MAKRFVVNKEKPFGLWYYHILNAKERRAKALTNASRASRSGNRKRLKFWLDTAKYEMNIMKRLNQPGEH